MRYLTSLVPITNDLERIGDEAEGIVQLFLRMVPYHYAGTGAAAGGLCESIVFLVEGETDIYATLARE